MVTRPLPCDFALYIAMSASRSSDSAVLSRVAKVTPTLAGTAMLTPITSIGSWSTSSSRSASAVA